MSKEKQIEIIRDLLTEFDEMGFAPTILAPNPEAYAIKWRAEITKALEDCFKQSERGLTKAHLQAHYEAICALADMVGQFGYSTTFRKQEAVCDGGLSALEYAFGALQDCGCRLNSNGTITLKNLWAFQEEFEAKMKGGAE